MLENNKIFFIPLRAEQLIFFGIHLGHTRKISHFLAGWFFYNWRSNIFIINLVKTFIFIKFGLKMATTVAKGCRPFWFVTMNEHYAPFLVRYAHICGEPYNVYEWIGGTLSNYKMILGWLSLLLYILNQQKYKLRSMDKRNLVRLLGHLKKKTFVKKNSRKVNRNTSRDLNRWKRSYLFSEFGKEIKEMNRKLMWQWKKNDENELDEDFFENFMEGKKKFLKVNKDFKKMRNFEQIENEDLDYGTLIRERYFDTKISKRYDPFKNWAILYYSKRMYPHSYKYYVSSEKRLYSKIFNFMNLIYYRKYYHDNSKYPKLSNLDKFNNYFYKNFPKKINIKNYYIMRNIFKIMLNRIKLFDRKFKKYLKNLNKNKLYRRRFKNRYISLKKQLLKDKWNKRLKIFNRMSKKFYYKNKFLSILKLRTHKRLLAKIKKLKKNSSFNKILKYPRWLNPFDPLQQTRKPGGGFVPTYLDNVRIIDEFAVSNTPFITLVDSNIVSGDVAIPFPSNDDSIRCILFYTYMITKCIFIGKFRFLMRWKSGIIKVKSEDINKKLIFLYNINKKVYKNKKEKFKDKDNIQNKFKYFLDDLIFENLEKFDVTNEIKYKLATQFELTYIFNFGESNSLSFLETEIFDI